MDTIQRVEISPSPGYPDVVRKIIIAGRNEDYITKTVTLICRIEHYDKNNHRLGAFAAIERDPFLLVADDTSKVDPITGALVFPDENGNYPIGATGQYTWLHAAVERGVNPFSIEVGSGDVLLQAPSPRRHITNNANERNRKYQG